MKARFENIKLHAWFSVYGDYHGVSDSPIIFVFEKDSTYSGRVIGYVTYDGLFKPDSRGSYCFNTGDDVWDEEEMQRINAKPASD